MVVLAHGRAQAGVVAAGRVVAALHVAVGIDGDGLEPVGRVVVALAAVEVHARQLAGVQRQHHPAADRGVVEGRLHAVAPSHARVLRLEDEVGGALDHRAQQGVAGQPVQLGDGHGADGVVVDELVVLLVAEAAVVVLHLAQVQQRLAQGAAIDRGLVVVAGAAEREHGQPGQPDVAGGFPAGVAVRLAYVDELDVVGVLRAFAGAVFAECGGAPVAFAVLVIAQPFERGLGLRVLGFPAAGVGVRAFAEVAARAARAVAAAAVGLLSEGSDACVIVFAIGYT